MVEVRKHRNHLGAPYLLSCSRRFRFRNSAQLTRWPHALRAEHTERRGFARRAGVGDVRYRGGMSAATDKAQELLGGRVAVVGELEKASAQVDELRERLDVAERDVAQAWSAATSAGWTPRELRSLGFKEPRAKRAPKRARTSRDGATHASNGAGSASDTAGDSTVA